MKILILTNSDLGLYKFRKELLQCLINQGNEVFISLPDGKFVQSMVAMGCHFIPTSLERRGMNPLKDLILLLQYKKILQKIEPDVVLTYTIKPNIYGGIVCRICRVKYIENITGLGTAIESEGALSKVLLLLYKIGLKGAAQVFFQNKRNQKFFKVKGIIKKSKLIPGSGVNLQEHCYEEYPNTDEVRFLFIGRIMRDKGIDELLICAQYISKKYKNVYFDLIGDYDEEKYRDEIAFLEKTGTIKYLGSQDNVHAFIRSHHAVVLPSYHEGLSNVLLEAAACGRPVLATLVPGCREAFADGISGIGFSAKSSDALIRAVEKFISLSYEKRKEMGVRGREKMVQEFDRRLVISAYMDEICKSEEKNKV